MNRLVLPIFTLVLVLCLVTSTVTQAAPVAFEPSDDPVEVSADRLEVDDNANTLVFIGNAVVKQAEATMRGERITVIYTEEEREIEQVVAEGDVHIVHGARVATGEKAIFYHTEGRVVLTGEPEVSEGENFIRGQEITLYLDEQRSVVSGGEEGRVNAVFKPKAESP